MKKILLLSIILLFLPKCVKNCECKIDKEIKCLLTQILAEQKTTNNIVLDINHNLVDVYNEMIEPRG